MKSFARLCSCLSRLMRQRRASRPVPKRRPPPVSLRLEELEHRTTPSVTVVPQQFTTNQYTALSISQSQMLTGDTGSSALAVSNPTQPANATLVDNHNGTFTFTPDAGFTGSTTFQYTVSVGLTELTASDGAANDQAGDSVSIDGDTAVIGAPGSATMLQPTPGAAYVFVRSGDTWTQQAKLTAADGTSLNSFGYAVSISGDTAVIGAPGNSLLQSSGAAYVFVRSSDTWTQQAKLTAADGATGDQFGDWVSVGGDTAVIGAQGKTVNGQFNQGAAYVFAQSGNTWSQQAELTAADGAADDNFGDSVSVSGDTAVIGTYKKAAYVFVLVGGTWSQQAELTAADGAFGDWVSVSGDTAVIGAYAKTVNGQSNQGAAYVFVQSGDTWSQQAELTATNGAAGDQFGDYVSVSGDTAVIGAQGKTVNGQSRQGAAYVFVRSGDTWTQQTELTAADGVLGDEFGWAVSVSGDTAIVAAPFKTINGQSNQGAAYVEDLSTATATATVQVKPATAQLFVSPASLPIGTEGQVYTSTTFTATGGAGSGYALQESGLLSAGITFDAATGQLTGTPSQVGIFPGIVIAASDGQGGSGSQTYTLTINYYGVNGLPVPFPSTIYAPPTSTTAADADDEALLRGLYHSVLDRDAEPIGLAYWENVLTKLKTNPQALDLPSGTDRYQYVAQSFWDSPEHRQDEIETYYQNFLGRALDLNNPADAAGLQYWTKQFLINGGTEATVARGFLTSPEYLFDHRADPSLASTLNTSMLAGTATTADLQAWTSNLSALDTARASLQNQTFSTAAAYQTALSANLTALDNEKTQTGVLFDMLSSTEYELPALDSFYSAFLRRSGTQAELQAWQTLLDSSGNRVALGTIAETMLASSEYRSNAVNSEV